VSKQKPSAAKAAAAGAAPQEYRKPRADIYTVLLVVALLMLILATTALWMTMKEDYDNMIKDGPKPTAVWHQPATGTTFDVLNRIA
jgi:hypothetical protein